MQPRIGILACTVLLIGALMTACGTTATVILPASGTATSSTTPTSTPKPGAKPPPGATSPSSSSDPTPVTAVYGDLTGVWQGDDQGYYYIRQAGNSVTWGGFSLDDGVSYTNVLCATRNGNSISGNWADVPRGNAAGSGTLSLQVDASNPNDIQIHKTVANAFGASTWHKVNAGQPLSASLPSFRSSSLNPADLTGAWIGGQPNDGSLYYVHQVSSTVYWLGVSENNGQSYANVFCGQRSGNSFAGNWYDIPRGASHSSGMLTLTYIQHELSDNFQVASATGGFATTYWLRG